MEDSTPLLSKPDILDDLVEPYLGGFRWSQAFQVLLISMASFFDAQQTFITIFTDANPSWHFHCTPATNSACRRKLPADSWQWDRPAATSIVSDCSPSLLCTSNKILSGLPASSFFIGCLLGGIILSIHGDSLGRKKLLILSCVTMSASSFLTAFSSNLWTYSGLRAVSGIGCSAIESCILILSTESVGKRWRGKVGVVGFLCSTFGYLSLPAIAYLVRNCSWRNLYFLTSTPAIVYCMLIQFGAYESPKWLIQQGRLSEASAVLNANIDLKNDKNRPESATGRNPSLIKLLSDRSILQQLTIAMLIGLGIGMSYYGTPLGLGNFELNLYLSVALSATLEIPSAVMTFCLAKFRRRTSLLALSSASGACGIICILVEKWAWLQIGLQLTSFLSACTAFNLLLIYTAELFPTSVRNTAVSMVCQAIELGGAVSPLVIAIGEGYNKSLPLFLFGVMIFVLGSLVLFLKETMDDNQRIEQSVLTV